MYVYIYIYIHTCIYVYIYICNQIITYVQVWRDPHALPADVTCVATSKDAISDYKHKVKKERVFEIRSMLQPVYK